MTAETPSSVQQVGIGIASIGALPLAFSVGATAIESLWGVICGIGISGCVFFI